MSLVCWLPLNGDLHNQGLISLPDTSVNTFSYSNGKIGQCATGRVAWHLDDEILGNTWSVAMWVKPESLGANNNILFCKNGTSSTDCHIYFSIISTTQLNLGVNGPSSSVTATGQTFTTGTWYHVAATYDGTTATIYLNGIELKHGTVTTACPTGRLNMNINGRSTNAANTSTTGNITCSFNDFRLYDHCLSPAEVKEISQGLVLHYKLDSGYNEDTVNLAAGVIGYDYISKDVAQYATTIQGKTLYGNKIFTYSAYIKNTSDHPLAVRFNPYNAADTSYSAFNGNYIQPGQEGRSIVTADITDTSKWNGKVILYIQNGNAGTVPTNKTFYIKEVQVEEKNHATPFTPNTRNNTIIEDSSGYNHNGVCVNTTINNDSPRYDTCISCIGTTVDSSSNTIVGAQFFYCNMDMPPASAITISWWGKNIQYSRGGIFETSSSVQTDTTKGSDHSSTAIANWDSTFRIYNGSSNVNFFSNFNKDGNWHHHVITFDGANAKYYCDSVLKQIGTLTGTLPAWKSFCMGLGKAGGAWRQIKQYVSDLRIYCTALDSDSIRQLYQVGAKIDNKQNWHTFEFIEGANGNTKITKSGQTVVQGNLVDNQYYNGLIEDGDKVKINSNKTIAAAEFIEA